MFWFFLFTAEETPSTTETCTSSVPESLDFFTDIRSLDLESTSRDRDDVSRHCVSEMLDSGQEGGVPTPQDHHRQLRETRRPFRVDGNPLGHSRTPLRRNRNSLGDSISPLGRSVSPLTDSTRLHERSRSPHRRVAHPLRKTPSPPETLEVN